MKPAIIAAVAATLASLANAAPTAKRAAGPSGKLLMPIDYNIAKSDGFMVDYEPVEVVDGGQSGQKTTNVVVNLVQGQTIVPLGCLPIGGVEPGGSPIYPNQYIDFASTTRQGFKCGSWQLQVTEFQTGPVYNGSFLSASPTLNISC